MAIRGFVRDGPPDQPISSQLRESTGQSYFAHLAQNKRDSAVAISTP